LNPVSRKVVASIIVVVIAIATVSYLLWHAWYAPPPAPPTKIKVGILEPLTGGMSWLGTWFGRGFIAAVEYINEKGGVLGKYKVEYVLGDARSDPKTGGAEAERLITVEKVNLIFGCYGSSITLVATEVAERYGIPFFVQGADHPDITRRGFKWVFRAPHNTYFNARSAVNFWKEVVAPKLGIPITELRVAIAHEDSGFGTSYADCYEELAKEYGYKVVVRIPYSSKATDLSSVILKLKATDFDILSVIQYEADAILFYRQMKELDLNVKCFFFSCGGTGSLAFGRSSPDTDYVMGVVGMSNAIVTAGDIPRAIEERFPEAAERMKWFISWRARNWGMKESEPTAMEAFGVGIWVFEDVLPRAITKYGGIDPESIRKAAVETDYPFLVGYGFPIKFYPPGDPNQGQNMLVRTPVLMWLGGNMRIVWPPEIAHMEPVLPFPTWEERAKRAG